MTFGRAALAALTVATFTACDATITSPEALVLWVGAERVDCVGVGPRSCLLVKSDPTAQWEWFYDPIEGFEWQPGFIWKLRVLRTHVANPPADGSSLRWRLIEVLEKVRT